MRVEYLFDKKYKLTCTHNNETNCWWLTNITKYPRISMLCFKTYDNTDASTQKYIKNIDEYIKAYNDYAKNISHQYTPDTIKITTDTDEKITYVKTISLGHLYDCVHVSIKPNDEIKYVRKLIDFNEYNLAYLDNLINKYGYKNFLEFLQDMNHINAIENNQINLDSIDWIYTAEFIASIITENENGRTITLDESDNYISHFINP